MKLQKSLSIRTTSQEKHQFPPFEPPHIFLCPLNAQSVFSLLNPERTPFSHQPPQYPNPSDIAHSLTYTHKCRSEGEGYRRSGPLSVSVFFPVFSGAAGDLPQESREANSVEETQMCGEIGWDDMRNCRRMDLTGRCSWRKDSIWDRS